jgi:hypothetical protein
MDIIDKVREDDFYKHFSQNLTDDQREHVERYLRDITGPLEILLNEIQGMVSDEQGFFDFIDALDSVTTADEVKRWQEKN